jgi:tetratricopeptide (TPR) repeat protein
LEREFSAEVGSQFEDAPEMVAARLLLYAQEHHDDNSLLEVERTNIFGAATWAHHTDRWAYVIEYLKALDSFMEMRGYYGERRQLLGFADDAADKLNAPALRAGIHVALGVMASKRGAWNEALEYYSKSNQIIATTDKESKVLFADIAGNTGSIFLQTGRWEEATEHYQRALDAFEQIGDHEHMADALDNLGLASLYKGETNEAIATLERALALRQRLKEEGKGVTLAATYSNLGNVYTRRGQLREAAESFQKALEWSRTEENPYSIARTLSSLALVYSKAGHFTEALKTYEASLAISKRLDDVSGRALTYLNMGLIHEQARDYDRAEALYNRGLIICDQLGDLNGMAQAYGNLGNLNASRGIHQQAELYYRI